VPTSVFETAGHVESCRFPGPVWSDETDDLVFGDFKGDVVEGEETAEAYGHVLEGERDRVRGRFSHGVQKLSAVSS